MHFQRLRLTGFKSFVDATEFRIEPGLTGVVGPNGCGKSNLLEALRWVMGASSAKAMRGSGMDDVIFAGTTGRPSRNHAEVSLAIDNADHRAPQPFTDAPMLEVVRRIDRGAGSTYRVNGKEVRARDVQLLFADASTGANSPALVRQGQISELIAAKPQNRRRILEEAGGVSGLHTRRHEAELRLRAAETNLSRLDDIGRELETTFARLRREARHAERYKKISAEIRALQTALLLARWSDAREAVERANDELDRLVREVEETARGSARAQAEALAAAEALKPLREEDVVAAAVLHRLSIEKDRIDVEERQAREAVARARAEIERIDADSERELQMAEDARGQLARLTADIAALEAEVAAAPERGPELENAWKAADAARAEAEAQVERLASGLAAAEARATADAARLRDSSLRLNQTMKALASARAEREALGVVDDPQVEQARVALSDAVAVLQAARTALEDTEAARTAATEVEAEARRRSRDLEDRLGRLQTEARGLAQLLTGARKSFPPALDSIRPAKGWETALAAGLGDDLEAALDPNSPSHWAGRDLVGSPEWPGGVRPLAEQVEAPPALAARLAWIGVVEGSKGDALARALPVGARLVSREGDLWRWDGFVARADAPRPAAVRLAQKSRLAEVEEEIDRLKPLAEQAATDLKLAQARLQEADAAVRDARKRPPEAERFVAAAREAAERHSREHARREARAHALDETVARLESEASEAEAAARAAQDEADAPADLQPLRDELEAAREALSLAREIAAGARSAFDAELRERMSRDQRLSALLRDRDDWSRRAEATLGRMGTLASDRERAVDALARAEAAPEAFTARREALLDQFAAAEARRKTASDALGQAEAAAQEADRTSRTSDSVAAEARERRAAAAARAESARERLTETETQLRETAQTSPEELARKLKEEAIAQPTDTAGAENLLYGLEREREALGLVNLRAEEEAEELGQRLQTMRAERADLIGAIAKLRDGIDELNAEGRERLLAAFDVINGHFQALFQTLFDGGVAELRLIESDDPLEAGLEIYACPPGKRLSTMSLMSGGEQALTATALIFGVFLANPAPVCVLDEVDAPLDDANVDRFCRMLDEMRRRTQTRFIVITHNPVTMARMDRLYGVTMAERGVSQLVSVDLSQAAALAAE